MAERPQECYEDAAKRFNEAAQIALRAERERTRAEEQAAEHERQRGRGDRHCAWHRRHRDDGEDEAEATNGEGWREEAHEKGVGGAAFAGAFCGAADGGAGAAFPAECDEEEAGIAERAATTPQAARRRISVESSVGGATARDCASGPDWTARSQAAR